MIANISAFLLYSMVITMPEVATYHCVIRDYESMSIGYTIVKYDEENNNTSIVQMDDTGKVVSNLEMQHITECDVDANMGTRHCSTPVINAETKEDLLFITLDDLETGNSGFYLIKSPDGVYKDGMPIEDILQSGECELIK